MATATVFANGLSIACKSVDGKSAVAFPDPCWTNPGPSAGPIVLPFANTAYARDTSNASKTVFIGSKPVMLKDKSFFKTSEGNEAAAYGKGFFTGVKKSKAYFASWSMNVKIEGFNVCRHTDLMTHNHGSKPGNTAFWYYTDKANKKPPKECAEDCERMEKKCGRKISKCEAKEMCGSGSCRDKKKKKKVEERRKKKGNAISLFKEKVGKKLKDFRNWKQEHCRGALLINSCGFDKAGEMVDKLNEQVEKLTNIKDEIPRLFGEFIDNLGVDGLSKWADEIVGAVFGKGAKKIALKKIPVVGQLDSLYDAVQGVGNLSDFRKTLETTLPQLVDGLSNLSGQIQESIEVLKSDIKMLEKIKNGEIDKKEFLKKQKKMAKDSPCIAARKCNLTPYSKDRSLASKEGCCPGQTPHHMIPNSMLQIPESEAGDKSSTQRNTKDSSGKANCPGYTYGSAPTVCAEGLTQNECTHKKVHDKSANLFRHSHEQNNMTLDQVIKDAEKAHAKAFRRSGCSRSKKKSKKTGCIEAQLRDYFKDKCNDNLDFRVRPVDGKGGNMTR